MTQKERATGQKSHIKGHLVAKGFQEGEKPQSDSPTLLREPLLGQLIKVLSLGVWILEQLSCKQSVWIEKCIWNRLKMLRKKERFESLRNTSMD